MEGKDGAHRGSCYLCEVAVCMKDLKKSERGETLAALSEVLYNETLCKPFTSCYLGSHCKAAAGT